MTAFPLARWILVLALAEAIGMTAASSASVLSAAIVGSRSDAGAIAVSLGLVVAGGLVEGAALGILPAIVLRAWRPAFRRRWWLVSTILVAGLGWAAASLPAALSNGADAGGEPPLALVLAGAAALGAVMGAALGAAQSPAFRGALPRPGRWVGVSVAAWTPAMVVIYLGATTPDASWPPTAIVPLGALTGLVAGTVLGGVTGLLLRRAARVAP